MSDHFFLNQTSPNVLRLELKFDREHMCMFMADV